MNQQEFIYNMQKAKPLSIVDDGHGTVTVVIRKTAHIIHEYKKNNQMKIHFTDDGVTYAIPSHNELKQLLSLHLHTVNFIVSAMQYCEEHLQLVKE